MFALLTVYMYTAIVIFIVVRNKTTVKPLVLVAPNPEA